MNETVTPTITLRPLPSSRWITQDYGCGASIVSVPRDSVLRIPEDDQRPLTITSVCLNGRLLRHRVCDEHTVIVQPMVPLEGGYLTVHCTTPQEAREGPLKAPQRHPGTYPTPDLSWGFTAPATPRTRNPQ